MTTIDYVSIKNNYITFYNLIMSTDMKCKIILSAIPTYSTPGFNEAVDNVKIATKRLNSIYTILTGINTKTLVMISEMKSISIQDQDIINNRYNQINECLNKAHSLIDPLISGKNKIL